MVWYQLSLSLVAESRTSVKAGVEVVCERDGGWTTSPCRDQRGWKQAGNPEVEILTSDWVEDLVTFIGVGIGGVAVVN